MKKEYIELLKFLIKVVLLSLGIGLGYIVAVYSTVFQLSDEGKSAALRFVYLASALISGSVIVKSIDIFFWERYRTRKGLRKVPGIMKTGVNVFVYTAITITVIRVVFNVPINGILTASGAFGVVIGLALKELITDIFAGMILGIDRSLKIGDFVMFEFRPYTPKIGCISDMNWRTVILTTPENTQIIVPNSLITKNLVTNLSEPSPEKEFELIFTFDFDVESDRVLRVLNSALFQTQEIMQDPAPKARISRISGTGVEYKVKYYIKPAQIGPGKARHFVINNILYNLSQSGLSMSYPKTDVYTSEIPQRNLDIRSDRIALLKKIELFNVLSEADISFLAASLIERQIKKNEFIVSFGDPGSSMYILLEGLLSVFIIDNRNGTEIKVANLKPGNYFGEMSLLTGETRSASISTFCDSVLFELPKTSVDSVLRNNPDIALSLSKKIAETKLKNANVFASLDEKEQAENHDELTSSIFLKIRKFFNM